MRANASQIERNIVYTLNKIQSHIDNRYLLPPRLIIHVFTHFFLNRGVEYLHLGVNFYTARGKFLPPGG